MGVQLKQTHCEEEANIEGLEDIQKEELHSLYLHWVMLI
jgi:hypothetical protein